MIRFPQTIYTSHWDTLCFNKIEIDYCQHVCVWVLLWARVGGVRVSAGWVLLPSFCLQPGVCFVLKGLLLLTVLMCTGEAGQWRCMVTDSSHQAAGKKGAFPCSGDVFLPPCRVSDCRFHQMFIREGCGQRENSSQNHLFCMFVGCWAQRQWGGVEVTAGLWGRAALVCFSFRGTGRVLASRSGTAYGPVSSWPSPNELHFPLP